MMLSHKRNGLVVIGGVAVFLCLLVAASFLADGQREPIMRLQRTGIDAPSSLDAIRDHWYASGAGPDDSRKQPTWQDIIRSNYPAEPHYGPSLEQQYRKNPSAFFRVVRPGAGSMMLHSSPDAPNAMDKAKDRWYMAGKYDDHARELHGNIPQIGKYVQAGYPGDYKSPSEFPMGPPEYAVGVRALIVSFLLLMLPLHV
jgi:hypothetical protein